MTSNMHRQSWRWFFIFRIWVKDQFNTMLVLLIVFVWMKIKLAQAKVIQTMHPLVAIKTKSERKETIKEKTKFTPKSKSWRTMTLTQIKIKRSIGLWWPSPGFLLSWWEEKHNAWVSNSNQQKNSATIVKKAARSN